MLSTELDEQKAEECRRLMIKYPGRIPVIIKKGNSSAPDIDRTKYLVPNDITFSTFASLIRNRLKLKQDEAIFIMVNNTIITGSTLMQKVYKEHKSPEGYLLLEYSLESVFG
jgi:GABA(A) receptor-associated protein